MLLDYILRGSPIIPPGRRYGGKGRSRRHGGTAGIANPFYGKSRPCLQCGAGKPNNGKQPYCSAECCRKAKGLAVALVLLCLLLLPGCTAGNLGAIGDGVTTRVGLNIWDSRIEPRLQKSAAIWAQPAEPKASPSGFDSFEEPAADHTKIIDVPQGVVPPYLPEDVFVVTVGGRQYRVKEKDLKKFCLDHQDEGKIELVKTERQGAEAAEDPDDILTVKRCSLDANGVITGCDDSERIRRSEWPGWWRAKGGALKWPNGRPFYQFKTLKVEPAKSVLIPGKPHIIDLPINGVPTSLNYTVACLCGCNGQCGGTCGCANCTCPRQASYGGGCASCGSSGGSEAFWSGGPVRRGVRGVGRGFCKVGGFLWRCRPGIIFRRRGC